MAIRYHYDLYPRTDPRDGARIRRFTKLQRATYRDVIGVGSGAGVIRSTDSEADDLDPRGEQFVRVVREDTVAETEATVGGFWINNYKHDTAVSRQTKRLTFAGAGTMAYLARARMAPHTYIHDVFTGQDPIAGVWNLWNQSTFYANGNYLGAMLWRVIYEAQHWRNGTPAHRHADGETYTDTHPDSDRLHGGVGATAIPDLVMGFDQFEDSDGNPWTAKSGEFRAQVNENVLSVVQRLMQAGLYVEMDPVTFELRAWQNDDHRRDRTGGAWGASVVRFQAPTDGTVDTGNMLSDSEREINSYLKRTLVWAGSGENWAASTGSSDIPWEGGEYSDAAETDALQQLASTQIQAREEAADAGSVRMKLGTTPLSGRYRPWEEVRLDDLVTLDTGSGVWDYSEDTYPVAGLRIELQKSGAWWAWAELGASQPSLAERKFDVAPPSSHTHPLPCQPGFSLDFEAVGSLGSHANDDPDNYTADVVTGPNAERVELVIERGAAVGQSIVVGVGHCHNADPANAVWDDAGNTYTLVAEHRKAISGDQPRVLIYYCNVTNPLSTGDSIYWEVDVGSSLSAVLETDSKAISAFLFDGVLTSGSESGTGSGFSNAPSVAVGGGDLLVAFMAMKSANAITDDVDWTGFDQARSGTTASHIGLAGGFRIADAGGETWTGALGSSLDWASVGAVFNAQSGSFVGDGHPDLIGTSDRWSRCGHRHDLHRDTEPTVSDDSSQGYPVGTIWAQLDDLGTPTEIVAVWVLVDSTPGAAVWAPWPGGGGSGIAVEEEGSSEGTGILTLNFTGDVDVTVVGTEATVDVTGGAGASIVGREPLAGPQGFSSFLTYGTGQTLAALAAGVSGALAVHIPVNAPFYLEGYGLFSGDTATARAAEARLYVDSGSATLNEIANSAAAWSFTPSAASLRRVSVTAGAPVLLDVGSYWLVLRNSHATSTFALRRTSPPTIVIPDFRLKAIAALGSTIDLDTGWTNGNGTPAIWLEGRVLGRTTVLT
jgi:hypothetical protein